jgi:molybdenum cofactor guanylyltransferase
MGAAEALQIGGYVLAGGKSSRMGTDKSLVRLGGEPLIAHAVQTLKVVCAAVAVLTSNPALESYAPLVRDRHADCGPIGGIEAALAHSSFEWNLLLPVDVPFLPASFLRKWALRVTAHERTLAAYFEIGGKPQPGLLLIRRSARSSIVASIEDGQYKLLPAIHAAAGGPALWVERIDDTDVQQWFANINTPEELVAAERTLGHVREC